MTVEIKTVEEFELLIKVNNFVVVHFWAIWNKYDEVLPEALNELELYFKGQVKFCSLNIDKPHFFEFVRSLPIINLLTLGYFKNGNKVALEIGMKSKEDLQNKIEQFLHS